MTTPQPRAWAKDDRVAIRDRASEPWQLGTIAGLTPSGYLMIRDEAGLRAIRQPDDVRVVPVDVVPVDERHWLPEKLRGQLVRQQAAVQLRALAAAWPRSVLAVMAAELAKELDDLLDADSRLVAAARALLAPPAEQPVGGVL